MQQPPIDLKILAALAIWLGPAAAWAAGQTAPAPAQAAPAPEVISRNGYSFFTPFFYGYPGYPGTPGGAYGAQLPNPAQTQNTPINTCDGGGCSTAVAGGYNAVTTYGDCYTAPNGQSLRNLATWDCRGPDGNVVPPSNCTQPASPVPCQ